MTEVIESRFDRVRRQRREQLLTQFVDRSAEMALFQQVLDTDELPVMVVTAESGMGKSSLLMRMVHECALRHLPKAEVEWSSVHVLDELSVLRSLRDALGVDSFAAFTDLANYYTDLSYTPRLEINVNLVGGNLQVAGGASISNSSIGDVAGVVLRDNNFMVQRSDLAVPDEVRRQQLTKRFLEGLAQLSASQLVVLFFNATEKMSDATHQWLWGRFLRPIVDGALPRVRAVLLGQRPPPDDADLAALMARVQLQPLCAEDIDAYIEKRAAGVAEISAETRRELAAMLSAMTRGRPADVAAAVELYLKSRSAT
ncbi:hypothetical protein [Piscinibacter sakaiensis]|uniref:hypothetical protein n=1 Tax=Piscinibacter sakaiensis TaxID=1547922 RepID=UPI003AAD57FA